jgi:hypothetical protein
VATILKNVVVVIAAWSVRVHAHGNNPVDEKRGQPAAAQRAASMTGGCLATLVLVAGEAPIPLGG